MRRTIYAICGVLLSMSACKQSSSSSSGTGAEAKPVSGEAKKASDEITIGVLTDATGPTADVGTPYTKGMMAYIDNINASGGIKGHKIKPLLEDFGYKVPNAEEKYKK